MSVQYEVSLVTGDFPKAGTIDRIFVTLVGSLGNSEKVRVGLAWTIDKIRKGSVRTIKIQSNNDLGEILLVRLYKDKHTLLPEDSWYCQYVTVEAPNQKVYNFPCYSWLEDENTLEIIEGTARRKDEYRSTILDQHWVDELRRRQEAYQWSTYAQGVPRCIKGESSNDLPKDAQFTLDRKVHLAFNIDSVLVELGLNPLKLLNSAWNNVGEFRNYLDFSKVPVAAYVMKHWKEDTFFGYQYLNGSNPQLIRQCRTIPAKFPVTDEMVSPFLEPNTTLQQELQKGNIFLVDYELLDEIPAHSICGDQRYLEAPMCLLYVNPQDELIPIAIQHLTDESETPDQSVGWGLGGSTLTASPEVTWVIRGWNTAGSQGYLYPTAPLRSLPSPWQHEL
ncbi:hydroperoxide isomerase ALOXE3-like [Chiloscyllium plagiosum]|uniref:hydroperoxide isomerase ALOXE3-like n=1 Tax=Chiloscyllium plagiosum TaxID=36176 RepID=UPI001CB887A4|nr:hydroperoxide isomerase ALOXE3-like [Chiloscyllium plagiosum]